MENKISAFKIYKHRREAEKKQRQLDKMTPAEKLKLPEGHEGGIVVRSERIRNDEIKIHYNPSQTHNLIVGTTGSGKTQSIILPSILSIGNTDASMVINDPKGELYSLTSEYLKQLGYKVFTLNYFMPIAGTCFNQLFMVCDEYDKGLPHFYQMRAIDSIVKCIDILLSEGEENNLFFFSVETFRGSKSSLPPDVAKELVKGKYFSQGVQSVTLFHIMKAPKLSTRSPYIPPEEVETYVDFIHDIYASIYESIQSDFKEAKTGNIDSSLYNNEYLKYREEQTVMAAVDILNIISLENIQTYYNAKIKQNQAIVNRADPTSSAYKMAAECILRYEQFLQEMENGGFNIHHVREFLIDSKADHETIWLECETRASTYAGSVATMLVGKNKIAGDSFWNDTATALQKALILFVCRESHTPFSRHLGSVNRILATMNVPESAQNPHTDLDTISDRLLDSDQVKLVMSTVRMAPDKTKGSILSSADVATKIFGDYGVVDQAARHDFNPEILATDKTAVFLISPGNDDAGTAQYTILSTLFIEETYSCLNRYLAQTKDQTLPRPVYYLLDELANIPPIPELGSKISLARSKNIRMNIVLQSYEQLKSHYKDDCETIKENSQIIYLLSNNTGTAKEISERIGKETIEINSFSSSEREGGDTSSTNTSSTGRELYTPQEIMQMPEGSGIYLMQRQQPYETHLEMAYKWPIYSWLKDNKIENIHIRRNPQPVNYFSPNPIDFTTAYESLANSIILDKFIYNAFNSFTVPSDETEPAEVPSEDNDIEYDEETGEVFDY